MSSYMVDKTRLTDTLTSFFLTEKAISILCAHWFEPEAKDYPASGYTKCGSPIKLTSGYIMRSSANPLGLTPHFLMGGERFALFS
ncbi:MAG: hypothetical protein ACTHY9_13475 [Sphingobacterium sp.]